jgi:hypothetical protein
LATQHASALCISAQTGCRISTQEERYSMLKKIYAVLMVALMSGTASAVYNANTYGVVVMVATYADTDSIYFNFASQPSHPACNNSYFVIPESVTADRRKAMLARLLLAKEAAETVNVGYDSTGSCVDGYIRVHRVG